MASSKLMEAAADILSGSKKSAPAMPSAKLNGEVVDLGGPTPYNYKQDDDSAKIDATKAVGDKSGQNQASIKAKPSAANGKVVDSMKKEESESDGEVIDDYRSDIESLFAEDSTISEDFKNKATTIFETRVYDRVSQIQEQMETEFAGMLEEAVETIKEDLTAKVDDYLNYVVEQWVSENEVAIEAGLRTELTEEFISGLKTLFAEHYIDIPEDKVSVVEELGAQVEELENKLNEEIERSVSLNKMLAESKKFEVLASAVEGLTATQSEKLKSLAESINFTSVDEFTTKVETIRENYFPTGAVKADNALDRAESSTDGKGMIAEELNGPMANYVKTLGRKLPN